MLGILNMMHWKQNSSNYCSFILKGKSRGTAFHLQNVPSMCVDISFILKKKQGTFWLTAFHLQNASFLMFYTHLIQMKVFWIQHV